MSLHGEGQGREIVVAFVRGKRDVANQIDVRFRAEEGGGMCLLAALRKMLRMEVMKSHT